MKIILIKTQYKGLYLTENGNAWHKASKCEIKPTKSGKIRFNGKLYDLQKLIDWSSKNVAKIKNITLKPTVKKDVSISELKKQGFYKTKISGLFVSKTGLCYNNISKRNLTVRNGKTRINDKQYNVAKLILATFYKIPVRTGGINFKNGNNKDFSLENLEYKTTINQKPPVEQDLINCIRLYFEVDGKFKKTSFLFKYSLNQIILKRGFQLKYKGLDFKLFLEYSKNDFYLSTNQNIIFKKFNYTNANGKNAINKYLNLLVTECLQDFENGLLQIKDFAPNPKTKTQKLKELQKSVNAIGLNTKIPLRKKSDKVLFNRYLSNTNEILKTPL